MKNEKENESDTCTVRKLPWPDCTTDEPQPGPLWLNRFLPCGVQLGTLIRPGWSGWASLKADGRIFPSVIIHRAGQRRYSEFPPKQQTSLHLEFSDQLRWGSMIGLTHAFILSGGRTFSGCLMALATLFGSQHQLAHYQGTSVPAESQSQHVLIENSDSTDLHSWWKRVQSVWIFNMLTGASFSRCSLHWSSMAVGYWNRLIYHYQGRCNIFRPTWAFSDHEDTRVRMRKNCKRIHSTPDHDGLWCCFPSSPRSLLKPISSSRFWVTLKDAMPQWVRFRDPLSFLVWLTPMGGWFRTMDSTVPARGSIWMHLRLRPHETSPGSFQIKFPFFSRNGFKCEYFSRFSIYL